MIILQKSKKNQEKNNFKGLKMEFNEKLLDILACPLSGGELIYDKNRQELICYESRLAYMIKDGIPVLLVEEARNIDYPLKT